MQLHKERVQLLRKRYLESRIDLQCEHLKALHEMRTEHLNKQSGITRYRTARKLRRN